MGQAVLSGDLSDLQQLHTLHLRDKANRQNNDLPGLVSVSLTTSDVLTNIWVLYTDCSGLSARSVINRGVLYTLDVFYTCMLFIRAGGKKSMRRDSWIDSVIIEMHRDSELSF